MDRYQLRRDKLIQVLNRFDMMPDEDMLLRLSSIELFELRDRAVREQISLRELGRIFYHLNQKRGFKSSRKSATEEDNATEYKQMLSDNHEALGEFTIGQYFYKKLMENPMFRIKENIFYRADYQSEFDRIWTTQKQYYPEILTGSPGQDDNRGTLYRLIRNDTIYYQRRLKSAKHLIGKCTFEPVLNSNVNGSTMKASKRVMPKSHPLYQEFRLWQQINNLRAKDRESKDIVPTEEQRYSIWRAAHNLKELDGHGNLTEAKLKKILLLPKDYALNYEKIEGNKTWRTLQKALEKADVQLAMTQLGEEDLQDPEAAVFTKLWHCTYSFETEKETSNALVKNFGFTKEAAEVIAMGASSPPFSRRTTFPTLPPMSPRP